MGWFSDSYDVTSQVLSTPLFPDKPYTDPVQSGIMQSNVKDEPINDKMILAHTGSFGPKVERLFRFAQRGKYYYGLPSGSLKDTTVSINDTAEILSAINTAAIEYLNSNVVLLQNIEAKNLDIYTAAKYESDHYYNLWFNSKQISDKAYTDWQNYLGTQLIKDALGTVYTTALANTSTWNTTYLAKLAITNAAEAVYMQSQADTAVEISISISPVISITSKNIAKADPKQLIYEHLQNKYKFNPVTGELIEDPYGTDRTRYLFGFDVISPTEILITYKDVHYDSSPVSFSTEILPFTEDSLTYHIEYHITNKTPVIDMYWNYEIASGTIPLLQGGGILTEKFFFYPMMPIRVNGKFTNSYPKNSYIRKSTTTALKTINMDINVITKAIAGNPGIGVIDDVTVVFALHVNTQEQYSIEYFYTFFKKLIHDGHSALYVTEGQYNVYMQFSGISETTITGVIAPLHNYTSSINTGAKQFILRFQETATTYKQLIIYNLTLRTSVWSRDTQTFTYTLAAPYNDAFRIPVNNGVIRQMTKRKSTIVLYDAAQIVTYTVDVTVLGWFNNSIFGLIVKIIIIVVLVVVAIFVPPAWGAVAELIAGAAISEAISLALDVLAYILTKLFGAEIAGYIVLVVAVVVALISYKSTNDLMNAIKALSLVTQFASRISSSISSGILEKIKEDNAVFLTDKEIKNQELKKAEQLLMGPPGWLQSLWLPYELNPSQSPTDFYVLKTTTNMADVVLNGPTNYVKLALTLPKIENINQISRSYSDRIDKQSNKIK